MARPPRMRRMAQIVIKLGQNARKEFFHKPCHSLSALPKTYPESISQRKCSVPQLQRNIL